MGRKCIVCGELFGCQRGNIKYVCAGCRFKHECSIKLYFNTTYVNKEICENCRQGIKKEHKPQIDLSAIAAI